MPGTAPEITSNAGGPTAAISIAENTTAVTIVTATDVDGDPLTYSISGGADKAKFKINSVSGVLEFITAPDFESPTDVGANNTYEVIVKVLDGAGGLFDTQTITVTVTDVGGVTLTGDGDPNVIGPTGTTIEGDTLNGLGGNDTLDGGAGADTMAGGDGDDYYFVDNAGDVVIEDEGFGTEDTVESTISYTLGDWVNNLVLAGTAAINGTGNELDNSITGNSAANNIDGGIGADEMAGGAGNDTYYVDNLGDIITEAVLPGTDRVFAAVSGYALADNVENLFLSGTVATGSGNAGNNYLTGNASNNTLNGLAGNDTIDGAAGADTMRGAQGNDIYYVENASDNVIELANQGNDIVYSTVSYSLASRVGVENLTLTGSVATVATGNDLNNELTGNSADNTLTGGAGNDRLAGAAGADTMIGGLGNDSYFVDNDLDVVTEAASEGTDNVTTTRTYTLGDNVENLTLAGSAVINGTGNTLHNVLTGNGVANVLTGLAGNDRISGEGGGDTMIGGLGSDTYWVDQTTDVVTELLDEGTDTVNSSITYTLTSNVEHLKLSGFSNLNGTGNTLDNRLTGNFGGNTLTGLAGNDIIDGNLGADAMIGGLGDDVYYTDNNGDTMVEAASEGTDTVVSSRSNITLSANIERLTLGGIGDIAGNGNELANTITGNKGHNTIGGGAGNDTINAGAGNDVITGGTGADQMTGGLGADRFVFATITDSGTAVGATADNITDYGAGDRIDLRLIDAIASTAGVDDTFVVDTNGTFVAGEMKAVQSGSTVTVSLYTDSVAGADMVFTIQLASGVTSVDFML